MVCAIICYIITAIILIVSVVQFILVKKNKIDKDWKLTSGMLMVLSGLLTILITTTFCHANNKNVIYKEPIESISKIKVTSSYGYSYGYKIKTEKYEFEIPESKYIYDMDFAYGEDYVEYTKSYDGKHVNLSKIYINKETAEKLDIRIFEYKEPKYEIETEYLNTNTDSDKGD